MSEQQPLNIQAIVDLLGRRQPELLNVMRAKHSNYADILQPGKRLGAENVSQAGLLIDLAVNTMSIVKQECTSTYQLVSKRLGTSARLRLGGGILSSASSGGLVVALMQGATQIALIVGVLTFISSAFTLIAQYMEDYVGGQNSLREMRDRVVKHIGESAEVEAEIKLMEIRDNFDGIELQIRKLNTVIASIRQVQMTVR